MSDSVDLLLYGMETRMISQLCSIGSLKTGLLTQNEESNQGVSFCNLLENALSNNNAAGQESDDIAALKELGGSWLFSGTDGSSQPAGNMQVSDQMMQFIERHEGFSATAYRGIDSQNRTIGYGHVLGAGEAETCLSKEDAQALLKQDLKRFTDSVNREFAGTNLTQNQFDALVSFSYNLGANIWDKVPTLTNDIKSGATAEKLRQDFISCDHCNGVEVEGLKRRRLEEWELFVSQ